MKEILDAGWIPYISKYQPSGDKRELYEKGNYWMTYDGAYSYTGKPYLLLMVKDPVEHMDSVGDNDGRTFFTCKYKGKETLNAINELFFKDESILLDR